MKGFHGWDGKMPDYCYFYGVREGARTPRLIFVITEAKNCLIEMNSMQFRVTTQRVFAKIGRIVDASFAAVPR
jgi:hypothetical protein